MATIQQRLARLEMLSGGNQQPQQVVTIVTDRHSDGEIYAFLESEGIELSDRVSLIVNSIITPNGQQPGPQMPICRLL